MSMRPRPLIGATIRALPGNTEKLKQAICDAMLIKPEKHDFNLKEQPIILRHMSATGG